MIALDVKLEAREETLVKRVVARGLEFQSPSGMWDEGILSCSFLEQN